MLMSQLGQACNEQRTVSSTVAVLLLCVFAGIVPLAYASPPDPTWIAGIWDDADFDDVVLAIVSADAAASPSAPVIGVSEATVQPPPQARPARRDHRPRLTADRSPPFVPA